MASATIVPWKRLVWDATCPDTFAASERPQATFCTIPWLGFPLSHDQFLKTRSEVPIPSIDDSLNKLFIVHTVNNQELVGFSLSGYEFNYHLQLHEIMVIIKIMKSIWSWNHAGHEIMIMKSWSWNQGHEIMVMKSRSWNHGHYLNRIINLKNEFTNWLITLSLHLR